MPPLSVMIKPASSLCNLRCTYCFYSDVAARRHTASYGVMKEDVLEKLVRKAFAYAEGSLSFSFQGGEPTVAGKDFFRAFLRLVRRYQTQGTAVHCAIQTNATLLDEEWAQIFKEGNFLVGVSMDGAKALHDRYRLTQDGQPTYDLVEEKLLLLRDANVEYNILCVVTHDVAQRGREVFDNLKKHGYLQFIPCLDDFDGAKTAFSLKEGDWGRFLSDTFPLYERAWRAGQPVSIRTFDNWLTMAMGYPPESCAMCGRCGNYDLIEADGSVYPCDFYVLDEWRLGNVQTDSFFRLEKSEVGKRFRELSLHIDGECQHCPWYSLCRGGCRREREPLKDGKLRLNRLCADHRMFFERHGAALTRMAQEMQKRLK